MMKYKLLIIGKTVGIGGVRTFIEESVEGLKNKFDIRVLNIGTDKTIKFSFFKIYIGFHNLFRLLFLINKNSFDAVLINPSFYHIAIIRINAIFVNSLRPLLNVSRDTRPLYPYPNYQLSINN